MSYCGLLLNDGTSFVLLNDGASFLLLNDNSCATEPSGAVSAEQPAAAAAAAGGFAKAWDYDTARRRKREVARYFALQKIRSSSKYRSLQRKLAMLEEQLSDNPAWYLKAEIEQKIEEIKLRIRLLEDMV
jgi:hypothetical protein